MSLVSNILHDCKHRNPFSAWFATVSQTLPTCLTHDWKYLIYTSLLVVKYWSVTMFDEVIGHDQMTLWQWYLYHHSLNNLIILVRLKYFNSDNYNTYESQSKLNGLIWGPIKSVECIKGYVRPCKTKLSGLNYIYMSRKIFTK